MKTEQNRRSARGEHRTHDGRKKADDQGKPHKDSDGCCRHIEQRMAPMTARPTSSIAEAPTLARSTNSAAPTQPAGKVENILCNGVLHAGGGDMNTA